MSPVTMASRRKRCLISPKLPAVSPSAGGGAMSNGVPGADPRGASRGRTIFMATWRLRSVSTARYTTPIPPSASGVNST
jgi:hypothetical protein